MPTLAHHCPTLPAADDEEAVLPARQGAHEAGACAGTDQSATHVTQCALARWRSGLSPMQMQLATALSLSPQERWYINTRDQLDAWRATGGFDRDEAARA